MASLPNYPSLSEQSRHKWIDYIRPKEYELGFQKVGFLPTLWEAVLLARKSEKPVLLWAMNGHPMACT